MGNPHPRDLHDIGNDESRRGSDRPTDLSELRPLAEQLSLIAQRLMSGDFSGPVTLSAHNDPVTTHKKENADQRAAFAAMARDVYRIRRDREAIFGTPGLFGEPAWDILLDLYVAHAEGNPVSVSSACIGSAAPSTTGLRWLGVLTDEGFVKRTHDPEDQRRVLVELSETGLAAMDAHFARALTG
ncbi:MarR family winged helix-turn-helix transcriptional regulator [Erythrobacter sp. MTPC3]|uniref:MarR family winged helix-turn-helix transcriptional regulator n=1 Tax=Erythrobacter sp. MTPC3 TaxID=3056564 RepID=UPI0036F43539